VYCIISLFGRSSVASGLYTNVAAEVHIKAEERLHEGPVQASSSSPLFFPLSMGLRKNSRPS